MRLARCLAPTAELQSKALSGGVTVRCMLLIFKLGTYVSIVLCEYVVGLSRLQGFFSAGSSDFLPP